MKKILTTVAAIAMVSSPAFAFEDKIQDAATKVYGAINAFDAGWAGDTANATAIGNVDTAFGALLDEIGNYNSYITVQLSDGVDGGWEFNPDTLQLEYKGPQDPTFGQVTNTEVNSDSINAKALAVTDMAKIAILGDASRTVIGTGENGEVTIADYAAAASNGSAGKLLTAVNTELGDLEEGIAHFTAGNVDDDGNPYVTFAQLQQRIADFQKATKDFKTASDTANYNLNGEGGAFNGLTTGLNPDPTIDSPSADWGYKSGDDVTAFSDTVGSYVFSSYHTSSVPEVTE